VNITDCSRKTSKALHQTSLAEETSHFSSSDMSVSSPHVLQKMTFGTSESVRNISRSYFTPGSKEIT